VGNNAPLPEKLPDAASRLWHAERAVERGWSRTQLTTSTSRGGFGIAKTRPPSGTRRGYPGALDA